MSLSGLSSDAKLHLVFTLRNGQKAWCSGTDRKQHPQTFTWMTLPSLNLDAAESVPMTIDFAIVAQRRWQEMGYVVRLTLEPNGPYLDDDPTPPEMLVERTPKHAIVNGIDVLIAVGSDRNYWIRFPGSAIESLKGATPQEVVDKYEKTVAVHPQISRFVEKYQAATPEPQPAAAVQSQQAGPQFRRRPGDRRTL